MILTWILHKVLRSLNQDGISFKILSCQSDVTRVRDENKSRLSEKTAYRISLQKYKARNTWSNSTTSRVGLSFKRPMSRTWAHPVDTVRPIRTLNRVLGNVHTLVHNQITRPLSRVIIDRVTLSSLLSASLTYYHRISIKSRQEDTSRYLPETGRDVHALAFRTCHSACIRTPGRNALRLCLCISPDKIVILSQSRSVNRLQTKSGFWET